MKEETILIRFEKGKVKVSNDKTLLLIDFMLEADVAKFRNDVYWIVRPLNTYPDEKRLAVEIIGCGFGKKEISIEQREYVSTLIDIDYINFKDIKTGAIMLSRSGPKKGDWPTSFYSFQTHSKDVNAGYTLSKEDEERQRQWRLKSEKDLELIEARNKKRLEEALENRRKRIAEDKKRKEAERLYLLMNRTIELNHHANISSELVFFDGGVRFKFNVDGIDNSIEVTLLNPNIKKEYSAIRPYFSKIIGKDYLDVKISVKLVDGKIDNVQASCSDLKKIGDDFTQQVRIRVISDIDKDKYSKEIITYDDIFPKIPGESHSPKIFDGEQDFFKSLINERNTKHFKHLNYLSRKHLYNTMRIRYVFNPFAFLLLLKSETHFFIVWESLDYKDATYVWRVKDDKDEVKKKLEEVEKIVAVVKEKGRQTYLHTKDPSFLRVYHDYNEGGFDKWKTDFEEKVYGITIS